jgi:hypothetical protein
MARRERPPIHPDVLCVDGNRICVAVHDATILLGATELSVRMTISDANRMINLLQEAIRKVIK